MARTQMRLDALTGSLSSSLNAAVAIDAASLQEVMDHLASGIKRLHGGDAYHSQAPGVFSQDILVENNFAVDGNAVVTGSMAVVGNASMEANLNVAGEATLASATISDITAQHVMFAGVDGAVEGAADLKWDGSKVLVGGGFGSSGMDLTADGALSMDGALQVEGAADLNSSLDVAGAVALGAAGGAADTQIRGDLSVAEDATISGDLTVTGDFRVNGSLTYVNTTNLLVSDAKIVISSGSLVDGAGIYLANEDAGENIRWDAADTKWIASDKLAADTLQALDLSEAIVWADASGNLVEISAAQFGGYLIAGAGIDSVANGQIDATPYVAGTGVTISAFTASIGQPVAPSDSVTFAAVTGSNLTASRLMASDASKGMVSADLAAWVAGTADQVIVADDADGSITLSLPQSIASGSSVEFAKVQLDGADNYVDSSAEGLVLHAGLAGDSIVFEYDNGKSISLGTESLVGFTATDIMGALNELKSVAGSFFKISSPIGGGTKSAGTAIVFGGLDTTIADADKRIDVYVNGQLLAKTADYAYNADPEKLSFTFDLLNDDVVTVISR